MEQVRFFRLGRELHVTAPRASAARARVEAAMSPRSRHASAVTIVGALLALASSARAQDPAQAKEALRNEPVATPSCEATYSLFHPMPDACLGPIDTDRPHQTDTPVVVDPGHFQFESSIVDYERATYKTAGTLSLADNAYKVGLYDGVELQLFHTALTHEAGKTSVGKDLTFRAKLQLWGNNRTEQGLTLVPVLAVPLTGGAVAWGGHLFYGRELPWELDLELNAGAIRQADVDRRRTVPILSSALTHSFNEHFAVFGEVHLERWAAWDTYLDGGVIVHVTRSIQLDAAVYNGVTGNAQALTAFLGFSFRR
jgi:hypothetical protein